MSKVGHGRTIIDIENGQIGSSISVMRLDEGFVLVQIIQLECADDVAKVARITLTKSNAMDLVSMLDQVAG